jgi:Deoxyinosine 3''endonuclease (endonuclease V)
MDFAELHGWDLTPTEAIALQKRLARRVRPESAGGGAGAVRRVAAVDVSCRRGDALLFGAVVVLELPEMVVREEIGVCRQETFPYVPGLLSFRELPVLLTAFRYLSCLPDAVLVDGQGIAHPRRLGLASHLGLWLNLPTVGCAKSRLCGEYAEPDGRRGARSPLLLDGQPVGAVLRSRHHVRPLFVSPGHLMNTEQAVALVERCLIRYRLPEPLRQAHKLANFCRQAGLVPGQVHISGS